MDFIAFFTVICYAFNITLFIRGWFNTDIVHFNKELLCGKSIYVRKKSDYTSFPVCHRHNYYEIIYYKNCQGVCNVNGIDYPICNDYIFLLTPADYHKITTEYSAGSYSVNISFANDAAEKELIAKTGYCPRIISRVPKLLSENVLALVNDFNSNSPVAAEKLHARFNLVLAEILEADEGIQKRKSSISPYVQRVMAEIAADPGAEISLSREAAKLGLASSYLSKLFHDSVGITFKEYLNTVRTEYAKRLLKETDIAVSQIGFECGYTTPSQFFRVFKTSCGKTPNEFRKGE